MQTWENQNIEILLDDNLVARFQDYFPFPGVSLRQLTETPVTVILKEMDGIECSLSYEGMQNGKYKLEINGVDFGELPDYRKLPKVA